MPDSRARRPSSVTFGIVAGVVVGLVAATLVGVLDREGDQAEEVRAAARNAAAGGGYPLLSVDCNDPRGDTRGGGPGIPVSIPANSSRAGARTDAEVKINCDALGDNKWNLVGPNFREVPHQRDTGKSDEVSSEPGGRGWVVHMFSLAESEKQPHPNTLILYGPQSPALGQMTVELKAADNQNFRGTGGSNILGIKLSVTRPSPPQVTVNCLEQELPEGEAVADVLLPYRSGADVTIKCDPLKDKRWRFSQDVDSVSGSLGRAAFLDATTLRLYPDINVKDGNLRADLKPMSGETFKPYMGNRLTLRFRIAPYKTFAIGDSWTAAFGWYGDGTLMPATDLLFCKPGDGALNDRCSSNGYWRGLGNSEAALRFTDDYGYGNNISWAAQVAHRVIDQTGGEFKNLAVSGATPADFLPFRSDRPDWGKLTGLTDEVVVNNPDLVLLTLGGNPILSDVLDKLKECEGDRGRPGGLRECAEGLVNSRYEVQSRLAQFYRSLLRAPKARLVVSSYMTAIVPYYPGNNYRFSEWDVMGGVLNDAIARAVNQVKGEDVGRGRLFLAPPVKVNKGNESSSGSVQCRRNGHTFRTDGPSVLADVVQSDISLSSQANSFCGLGAEYLDGGTWRPAGTAQWFNGQDLGTHLTRLGNQQLADAALNVIRSERLLPEP